MSGVLSPTTARELDGARMLQQQGRAADAEAAYRRILLRERGCEPAAVGLGRLLLDQGRAEEAQSLARPFIRKGKAGVSMLSVSAAALKALGHKAESLAVYQAAAAVAPDSAATAHNVAAGLGDAGRNAETVIEAERAFRLGLDAPETWLVYGRALQGLQRLDDAQSAFERALARRPTYGDAARDLGQLIWMRGGTAIAALAAVDAALALAPHDPALALVKTRMLGHVIDEAAALDHARSALVVMPGDPNLALELSRLSLGVAPHQAHDLAQQVLSQFPDSPGALRALCQARLALGEAAGAAQVATTLLDRDDRDQQAIADLASAWRLAKDPRGAELYDYDRMVRAQALDTPPSWSRLEDYLVDLRAALNSLHAWKAHPLEQSLRGGSQTAQNLTLSDDPAIRGFFTAIKGPIRAYRDALGPGQDLLRRRNRGADHVHGAWSVRLAPRGFHVDHIHPEGWLSSASYIDVPDAVRDTETKAGWLRFGQPATPVPGLVAEHFVRPEPGLLALFPSYMWHGTVPFDGDQPRMSLAFDLISDAAR